MSEHFREERVELLVQPTRTIGEGQKRVVDRGVGFAEARQQPVTDAVAGELEASVGRVVRRVEAERAHKARELGPRNVEQRTSDRCASRRNPAQSLEARAAQELEEDRLDLVVAMMRGQETRRAELGEEPLEHGVAGAPSAGFGTLASAALGLGIEPEELEGERELGRQLPCLVRAQAGLGIEAVIDVGEEECEPALARFGAERRGEGGGVWTARERDQPQLVPRGFLFFEEAADRGGEGSRDLGRGRDGAGAWN